MNLPRPKGWGALFERTNRMKLISPFKSLIKGGVVLNFKISAAGGENVQMDILPQGKDSATGVSLPPKALVGTPEEIDASLEEYLQKYAASVTRVADVVANADAELQNIEQAAAAQAKKAVEEKAAKSKTSTPAKPGGKSAVPAPRKDLSAGMLNEDDDEREDDGETTLITTGAAAAAPAPVAQQESTPAAAPAAAATPPVDGVSQDLFVV